ncbi:hypothetical protein PG996_007653 [Apiospora saccharicola]|uniref:Apple domain-containing protein n=1 Tax=Apiospora saccharicola TaxID=335842 RepID=A0ABR1VDY7_9PEZI
MRAILVAALAVPGAVAASSNTLILTGVRTTTIWSTQECKSLFSSGGTAPRPLPTITSSDAVIHTTTTEAPVTTPFTVTFTAPAVTSTKLTSTSVSVYITTVTSGTKTVGSPGPTTTFATATFSTTECTNNITPQTVTVYSGVYTPVPGQATTLPASYPTQVICQRTQDVRIILFHTIFTPIVSITISPVVTMSQITATVTSTTTYPTTSVTWRTTVTEATTTLAAATTTKTIHTSCAPTVTKTYAAKCAPTNLVKDHNEQGLFFNHIDNNATTAFSHLLDGDASACCQACVENEDCSAVEINTSNQCTLYFHHDASFHPVCGSIGFTYRSYPNIWPGQGIWVQDGCGEAKWLAPNE